MGEKQLYGRFKTINKQHFTPENLDLAKKRKPPLIAVQDNAIRINHIKARIDKTQKNSKIRLCGVRDKTINHIISECSKLPQKEYKARNDKVGKVIHWEMCKKFKFDHTNKWYMHNTAPVLENDTHKFLWNFDIQTDHLIPVRRPNLIIINKKKRLCCPVKECEKKDKYLELAIKLKKRWNMKMTTVPIVIGGFGTITKGLLKGLEEVGWTGREYPNDSIAENGPNPETSPGDVRRLAVTQNPVKSHQLTLMWKTLKE